MWIQKDAFLNVITIYSSPSVELEFHPDRQLMTFYWKAWSSNLEEEAVQRDYLGLEGYITQYKPSALVVDGKDFPFHGNRDIASWVDFEFVPRLALWGVQRLAMVAPLQDVEIYQAEKIFPSAELEFEYFSTLEEAIQWACA
jgi:hypothetical protein